jgi:hypothetical protein
MHVETALLLATLATDDDVAPLVALAALIVTCAVL